MENRNRQNKNSGGRNRNSDGGNRNSGGGNRNSGGGYGNSGGGNRSNSGPKEMHKAVCSDCGQDCQVPFKPSKDAEGKPRPVYCRDCFQNHKKF